MVLASRPAIRRPTRLRRPRRRLDGEAKRRDTRCPIDGRIHGSARVHSRSDAGGYSVEFDLATYFLHDVPKDVAKEGAAQQRRESAIAFSEPANFQAWPDVPIHVMVGKDDRFFPRDFQARVAHERLGKTIDEIPCGHLVALSHPRELAEVLLAYVAK